MTLYCSQCGAMLENDADFCYQCGALKSVALDIDDSGNLRPVDSSATRLCPSCGHSNPFNDTVCESCGATMPSVDGIMPPKKLGPMEWAALCAGLFGGIAGICGLGHLIMRKWSRSAMYLGMSAVILYIQLSIGSDSGTMQYMFVRLMGFMVFFHSSLDLFRVVYAPSSGNGRGGNRWQTIGPRSTVRRTFPRCSETPEHAPN